MKKISTLLSCAILACGTLAAQNSLLSNPVTKAPFSAGKVDNIEIVANEKDVALVAFNGDTETFYVFDLQDNSAEDASKNEISSISNFSGILEGAAGQTNLVIRDIQVNPISKAMYVLASSGTTTSYIVKVEENGTKASVLDLALLPHSTVNWGGSDKVSVQDMAWGNSSIYITSGSNFSLDGEIAWIAAPFAHESTTTNRATSMFKTNWGGSYYTSAPLEKLDFGTIDDEDRLMGVTLCAPGFSVKTADLTGTDVLEVTEDFNIRFNSPTKVVYQGDGDQHWLFNLHAGKSLMRIGKKYIDGSQVTANKYNNNTVHLREPNGSATLGLSENQIKVYSGSYQMIAKWDNSTLLLLQNNEVSLMKTVDENVGITNSVSPSPISLFPNPTSGEITLDLTEQIDASKLSVIGIDGKEVYTQRVNSQKVQIDLGSLPMGNYLVQVKDADNHTLYSEKLTLTH